ncbi:Maf family protein [Aurantivibrio plasticivorans]
MSLYLASQSPRRQELLQQIGVEFEVMPAAIDESPLFNEPPVEYVQRVAVAKAAAVASTGLEKPWPVLAADTSVVVDSDILGKPADFHESCAMLRRLSGRSHKVLSAIAMIAGGQQEVVVSSTEVTFRALDTALIEKYWQSGEPRDKAGSYGIQGLGAVFVERIVGSYSGVVGLPIEALVPLLELFSVPYWQQSELNKL